ncbi:MAG: hypothetical protein FGM24_03560 [Candidatus Kapabacteria bacterium]|nr:hypothetical protein [Candidatus Kapabacteria bacterium]
MNRTMLILLVVLQAGLLAGGCHRGFSSTYDVRGIRLGEPVFAVRGMRLSDTTLRLSFATLPTLRTSDPVIRTVYAAVGAAQGFYSDTVDFQLTRKAVPSDSSAVTLIGEAIISVASATEFASPWVDVSVVTASDHVVFPQAVTMIDPSAVELSPFQHVTDDGGIELGAHVQRVWLPEQEYLPSSEDVRVTVFNASGTEVWNSGSGMAFLTMITSVQPQERGDVATVSRIWNGQTSSGTTVPKGTYTAEILIPAIPFPYRSTLDVQWPPQP